MTEATQCIRSGEIAEIKSDMANFRRWQTEQNGTLKSLHHGQTILNNKMDAIARESANKYQDTIEEVDRRVSAKSEALEDKMDGLETKVDSKLDKVLWAFIGILITSIGILITQVVLLTRGTI